MSSRVRTLPTKTLDSSLSFSFDPPAAEGLEGSCPTASPSPAVSTRTPPSPEGEEAETETETETRRSEGSIDSTSRPSTHPTVSTVPTETRRSESTIDTPRPSTHRTVSTVRAQIPPFPAGGLPLPTLLGEEEFNWFPAQKKTKNTTLRPEELPRSSPSKYETPSEYETDAQPTTPTGPDPLSVPEQGLINVPFMADKTPPSVAFDIPLPVSSAASPAVSAGSVSLSDRVPTPPRSPGLPRTFYVAQNREKLCNMAKTWSLPTGTIFQRKAVFENENPDQPFGMPTADQFYQERLKLEKYCREKVTVNSKPFRLYDIGEECNFSHELFQHNSLKLWTYTNQHRYKDSIFPPGYNPISSSGDLNGEVEDGSADGQASLFSVFSQSTDSTPESGNFQGL